MKQPYRYLLILGSMLSIVSIPTGLFACSEDAAMGATDYSVFGGQYDYAKNDVQPPRLNLERFQEGAYLFGGKTELPEVVISDSLMVKQQKMLKRLKKRLPTFISTFLDVRQFEGRMEPRQFQALRYYLEARYINSELYGIGR